MPSSERDTGDRIMSYTPEELEEHGGKPEKVKQTCTALVKRNPDAHLGAVEPKSEYGLEDDYYADPWDPDPHRDYCGFRINGFHPNLGLGGRGFGGREG
jgi:hypothetical protein